jgi:hypothetical protein
MTCIKNGFNLGSLWKRFQQVLKPILVFFVPSQMAICDGLVLAVPTTARMMLRGIGQTSFKIMCGRTFFPFISYG